MDFDNSFLNKNNHINLSEAHTVGIEGASQTAFSLNLVNTYETARSCVDNANIDIKKVKNIFEWGKKQKNAFNSIFTGLKIADKMGIRVRFLTLTTSDIQFENIDYDDKKLNDSFRKLKQRIARMTIAKLIAQGYIKSSDIRRYYGGKSLLEPLDMEYFKVTTNEGNGVIHCVYKGEYLPYNYLVDNWQDIHNSWNVNIKLINNNKKDYKQSSRYIVSQYISGQGSSYQRSSQSWKWIFRGYRRAWGEFLRECHNKYFYNPIHRRFYNNRVVVDIFTEWERLIMIKVNPPPVQFSLYGLALL